MTIGQRIIRPDTAFSVSSTKQKRPRVTDGAHLAFIRTLKCCICGAQGPDAAHIRSKNALFGKPETGMQQKASDKWAVPLCRVHHDEQHSYCDGKRDAAAEIKWWASKRIDPFGLALALYAATGDDEIAESILKATRVMKGEG